MSPKMNLGYLLGLEGSTFISCPVSFVTRTFLSLLSAHDERDNKAQEIDRISFLTIFPCLSFTRLFFSDFLSTKVNKIIDIAK